MEHARDILELIDEIERIACGEDQVAENDTEGLYVIYKKIIEWKSNN